MKKHLLHLFSLTEADEEDGDPMPMERTAIFMERTPLGEYSCQVMQASL